LPDCHPFEKWHERSTWTSTGYPVFSVGKPVVDTLYNTRCTGDVVIEIAKKMPVNKKNGFKWKNFEEVMKDQAREIYQARRGDAFGPRFEEMWVRLLERIGWRASSYPDFETFWKKCVEKGGWWDPIYYYGKRERIYRNEDGKFDFGIDFVRNRARHVGTIESLYDLSRFEVGTAGEEFPLLLQIHGHYPLLEASSRNEPLLMELMTFQPDQSGEWKMWVEINPEDAEREGLHNNDIVLLETPKGRMQCVVKLFPGNPPGTVSIPFGLGHKSGGRYIEDIGVKITRVS
jgi:anaerobic selenocysteine-containing dehydrogenase